MNGMMTEMMNPMMSGFGCFMGVFGLLLFVALVAGGVFLVLNGSGRRAVRDDHALEVARTRFAQGELNSDEFEALKRTLGAD